MCANTLTWEPERGSIDVTFIDGCHDKKFVINDTLKVLPPPAPRLWIGCNKRDTWSALFTTSKTPVLGFGEMTPPAGKYMKIVFAHNVWDSWSRDYHAIIAEEGRKSGFTVEPFALTPNPQEGHLTWQELDHLWSHRHIHIASTKRKKARQLAVLHHALCSAVQEADVLWVYNGANIHPAWLADLPKKLLTVYGCFDDPESSFYLSESVAPYFDACLVGNIAAIPLYQKWGCRQVEWGPIFCTTGRPGLSEEEFFTMERDIPFLFCGERASPWRKERLDYVAEEIPEASFYGRGWQQGFIDEQNRIKLYSKTQIGLNIHNSIGPINIRTFELPAHGIMQICDNKCRFGSIFELNREAVGYDGITEAVELMRYYQSRPKERMEIAWNGYNRYWRDYSPKSTWRRVMHHFKHWKKVKEEGDFFPPKSPPTISSSKEILSSLKEYLPKSIQVLRNVEKIFAKKPPQTPPKWQYHHAHTTFPTPPAYTLNPASTLSSFDPNIKEQYRKEFGFFETPNIVALNWLVASLVEKDKKILAIGGEGAFANEASADPNRYILCLEQDHKAQTWARQNRSRRNIEYKYGSIEDIDDIFDLIICINIVEHIEDYITFLQECTRLAKRAIFTISNRHYYGEEKTTNVSQQHSTRWNTGEFYYILKNFWRSTNIYAAPDAFIPICIPCDINTKLSPLIAICSHKR